MAKQENRRSKLLIENHFQKSFIFYTVTISLFVALIFYIANVVFFQNFMGKGESLGLPEGHVFFQFLDEQQKTMNYIFLVTASTCCLVISGFGLYFSNRVAGPINRVKAYLKDLAAGRDAKPLKFRAKDYFKDLADAANSLNRK